MLLVGRTPIPKAEWDTNSFYSIEVISSGDFGNSSLHHNQLLPLP